MPKPLTWDDAEDIGILLSEAHPELDPLVVRFTDLHRYVTELKPSKWLGTKNSRIAPRADLFRPAHLK
jgi:hypothetical protein